MARFDAPHQNPDGNSNAPLIAFGDIRMVFPGQSTVTSRYTGQQETIGRGPGLFAGFCTWYPRNEAGRRELEDFFFKLQGGIHTARILLPRRYQRQSDRPTGSLEVSTITAVAVSEAQGTMSLTFTTAGLTSTITAGDFVNINRRLYKVLSGPGANTGTGPYTITVVPPAQPAVGDVISRGQPHVDARATGDNQGGVTSEGWILRPVTLDWIEEV